MKWFADELDVVHVDGSCTAGGKNFLPYKSIAKTVPEMLDHLDRPDYIDRRSAPSGLVACEICVLGLPVED